MSRRDLLKLAVLSAVPASLLQTRSAWAADAIELGYPVPMSGPFTANGKFADLGMKLAVEQYDKVLGRPLAYSVLGTEGEPATTVRKAQESAQQKNAHYFAGDVLSSKSLTMSKEAEGFGGVFVMITGADEITGKDYNRATFRRSVPTCGAIERTMHSLIESMSRAKRWYTITPQYAFGDGLLSAAKNIFKEKGIEHVGNSYRALTGKEFSGYLTSAVAAKPGVLLTLNFGSQPSDTLRQAVSFSMKKNTAIPVVQASGLEQFESLGADLCDGVYFGAQYWHDVDMPINRDLVKHAQTAFKINPNCSLTGSHTYAKILLDTMAKAGNADPKAVIVALQGIKYDGLMGPEGIRAADRQVLKNYYLLKGKPKSRMKDKDDFVEAVAVGKTFLPVGQIHCKLV